MIRPSSTGTASAATSHSAKIAQERQAYLRDAMLASMTRTATITDSQASMPGGAASAYCASLMGSQCHGPPRAPGTKLSFSRSEKKVNIAVA